MFWVLFGRISHHDNVELWARFATSVFLSKMAHVLVEKHQSQGPEKHTKIKEYFPETGFDVLPAVPDRRAASHD